MPITLDMIKGLEKRERICRTLVEKVVALETYPYKLDPKDEHLLYHLKMILKTGSDDALEKVLSSLCRIFSLSKIVGCWIMIPDWVFNYYSLFGCVLIGYLSKNHIDSLATKLRIWFRVKA